MAEAGAGAAAPAPGAYVKFAGKECGGDDVLEAMKTFGPVSMSTSAVKKGYVEVRFEDEAGLAAAIAAGEVTVGEEKLGVEALKGKSSRGKTRQRQRRGAADENSLYVSGFPEDVENSNIEELFSKYGAVRGVETRKRKQKTGVAVHVFVNFEEKAGAEAALAEAEANGITFNDAALKVERRKVREAKKPASASNNEPSPTKIVYISNMAHGVDEAKLREVLEVFGTIQRITLRQRDCFASVEFTSTDAVKAAHTACAEKPLSFSDQKLVAEPWKSKREDEALSKTLHIAGFGGSIPSEDDIRSMMSSYGEIKEISIRPMRKFALVTFTDHESAAHVVKKSEGEGLGIDALEGKDVKVELSITQRKRKPRARKARTQANGAAAPAETEE
mmetsp:Transcript_18065/g.33376  ORF Transcript_18065/g.33376 Transcript_18065/m.33376 type:complete len:389 (+) Transcript_18065:119-1285(+)|eukprot:CAMPEP_0184524754 /NCGR_PEP_ID=MMETSP0198_2-20121128/9707_1 /TAXON_ID=1112570 /ORGANISM="Thraustochytrium sp., Strain LLF1b" /LENGTH=388 /DNA_ID=CAMNT_0026916115 /DNA_START=174 /DNA_END=1340 /DNA_ORIENTATION=+